MKRKKTELLSGRLDCYQVLGSRVFFMQRLNNTICFETGFGDSDRF